MDGIGAGKCTLEHIDEQSLQEGRDCTLRKKERKRNVSTTTCSAAWKKAKDSWDNFSLNRPIFALKVECLGSSRLGLERLTNFHLQLMSTNFYLRLISNSVFQSCFRTIFCWHTSTTKINNDKMIIQKSRTPKSLYHDFTVAKRFMKRNVTNIVAVTKQICTNWRFGIEQQA